MNVLTRAETILRVIKRGEMQQLMRELGRRLYSDDISFILRRDLSVPLPRPVAAKIPIVIRPIQAPDLPHIIAERPRRLPVLRADIPTCYVATTKDGSICYMVWLVTYDQQQRLAPYFKGELKRYHSDTVLLEFSYTFERFRGLGIMSEAVSRIAEMGLAHGARWVTAYVEHDNLASLRGCAKAGFHPHMVRIEKWRGIRMKPTFRSVPDGTLYSFQQAARNEVVF